MEQKRGQFGSNFGFLMAAVGSAVGLGNIWGFPYKMGANGGFAFLLIYLILVVICGFSVMLGEIAIGRKYGKGTVAAYRDISKKHTWVGFMGIASGFFILAFYSVLGGMVLRYTIGFLLEMFSPGAGFGGMGGGEFFGAFTTSAGGMLVYFAIFQLLNIIIVMGGISGGIEKFSKIAMPALAVMLLIVIIRSVTLEGAALGLEFMFKPDFSVFSNPDIGFMGVLKTAAGQMFFSLSLGMGCMITYGSYLSKKENLESNAIIIPIADTCIALMAGLAVMPAVGAFVSQGVEGISFGAGPGLLFITMSEVFTRGMGGFIGNLFGFLFYFLVLIAAVTSSISLLEGTTTFMCDRDEAKGRAPQRKKWATIMGVIIFIVGLPVALDGLGAGVAGGASINPPGLLLGMQGSLPTWAADWLDLYDMLAEGIMMPLGALVMSLIIGWGLKTTTIKEEVEAAEGVKMKGYTFWDICFKILVPIVMVVVLLAQIESFFNISILG